MQTLRLTFTWTWHKYVRAHVQYTSLPKIIEFPYELSYSILLKDEDKFCLCARTSLLVAGRTSDG